MDTSISRIQCFFNSSIGISLAPSRPRFSDVWLLRPRGLGLKCLLRRLPQVSDCLVRNLIELTEQLHCSMLHTASWIYRLCNSPKSLCLVMNLCISKLFAMLRGSVQGAFEIRIRRGILQDIDCNVGKGSCAVSAFSG